MIKLKSGAEIAYNREFDQFFQSLLDAVIKESYGAAKENRKPGDTTRFNELLLKEVMDNCIYVTHQLFEIAKDNEALSKFMVTGFLFNSVVLSLSQMPESTDEDDGESGTDMIH
ncbi:MAG: hypothetical protein JXA20_15155 [Spirochaetes bacterium]|nr:hypothetical protein [Spirochaetota bacterium]